MAKSDIRMEQALSVLDRVAQELGLLVADTSFGKKIQGPSNKHRMYIQKGQFLGRIDFTIPLDPNDPAYVQLGAPNGSVKCHVVPNLEQLERCLRMLGDAALDTQTPNKPRPFSAVKAPVPRTPKALAVPVPMEALKEVEIDPKAELHERIRVIRERLRDARIRNILENPEKYGYLSEFEAGALVDGRYGHDVQAEEVAAASRHAEMAETNEILAEAGIEVT